MSVISPSAPDLAELTARQRSVWSTGDYSVIASRVNVVAERLCDDADLRAGWRVLDVATGSGNAALAAARIGCTAVGVDYVAELLERARERAVAERLDVGLEEADAQALPFPDAAFDAVTSVFGVMFAPDQARAASELLRVVRPGGTVALASWMPDGFVGELFGVTAAHVPPGPPVPSPFVWGTEHGLRTLLGPGLRYLQLRRRRFMFRFRSAEQFVEVFGRSYGPMVRAFEAAGATGRSALEADLLDLVRRRNRLGEGSVAIAGAYLEAIGTRR
jgi:SAM-dependent methyltransferase